MDYKLNDSLILHLILRILIQKIKVQIKELTYTPNLSASLNLNYKIIDPLSLNTNIRYIGRQYEDSSNNDKLEDYTLVDLGLSMILLKLYFIWRN